jgi:hypothetical protein
MTGATRHDVWDFQRSFLQSRILPVTLSDPLFADRTEAGQGNLFSPFLVIDYETLFSSEQVKYSF